MLGVFTYPLVVDEEFQIPRSQDQWPAELRVVQFIVEWLPFWQLRLHFDTLGFFLCFALKFFLLYDFRITTSAKNLLCISPRVS